MFSLAAIPLIAATGAAIDYSHAYEQRMVVQDALDAAALAANRLIGLRTEDEIYAEAQAFFEANISGSVLHPVSFTMQIDGGSVRLDTTLETPTAFLGIVGIPDISFDIFSVTTAGAATYEVALVLDNSGSMQGSKISTLRSAATDLVNSLFALSVSNPKPDPVRVGLVPFAASVNVGPGNRTATWMDRNGIAANASVNFQTTTNRGNTTPYTNTFALFDALNNVSWRGCVEARPYPYMVNDTPPSASNPSTLFVPMFAPDEPGNAGSTSGGFVNSYLSDTGGNCVNTESTWTTSCNGLNGSARRDCRNNGGRWVTQSINLTNEEAQERTCKYQGISLGSAYRDAGEGPNLHCTANALTPLSTNQSSLISAINAMQANGNTNIEEGVMWGWRVLSSTEPFDEGRAYDEVGNHKIMVVMTDGANTYNSESNMNRSDYAAFNYITHGVLGTTSSSNGTVVSRMNDRTLEACTNAKAEGITIYTVAFQVSDYTARQILQQCASSPSKAFESNDNAELLAAFRLIAQDIWQLRIAE